MKTASYRWVTQAAVLLLASVLIFGAGYGLRLLARHNLAEQRYLMKEGVAYAFPDSFSTEKVTSEDIRHLLEKRFYRERMIEPVIVGQIKGILGATLADLYFQDVWELFWYLDFTRDENALYTALEMAIKGNAFASSARCLDAMKCEVKGASSNVNRENGEMLFEAFDRFYITPAIDDLKHFNAIDARRRATDAISLARLVDFDDNFSMPVYDKVLVIGGFLTASNTQTGELPSTDDIDLLMKVVASRSENPDYGRKADDQRVAIYTDGISALRNRCFTQASDTFARGITETSQDAVSELFAFLAIRTLAHPIIAQQNIDATDPNPLTLKITDCKSPVPIESIRAKFDAARQILEKEHIRHKGLLSDIEYYSTRFPRTASETINLHTQVQAAPQEDASSAVATKDSDEAPLELLEPAYPREVTNGEVSLQGYRWPVSGRLMAPFSPDTSGVDIEITGALEVLAARAGKVLFAGEQSGSHMVLIGHDAGIVSVYRGVSEVLVSKGAEVDAGSTIAQIAKTDEGSPTVLHFELRRETAAIDPTDMLP